MWPAIIKACVVIMVLLGFYKLLLEKESLFKTNRIYLLLCLFAAFILPFVSMPELNKHQGYVNSLIDRSTSNEIRNSLITEPPSSRKVPLQERVAEEESKEQFDIPFTKEKTSTDSEVSVQPINPGYWSQFGLTDALKLIYALGVVVLTFRLVRQVTQVLLKVRKAKDTIEDEGVIIVNLTGDVAPCSFFKYIFINPENYDYEVYEQILLHERIHVEQRHSIDLMLSEITLILMWFNPFVWLLRKEIEKNIEYQTDDLLVNGASDVRENYQMNLVKIANGNKPLVITTNYNQSLIKQRILKMNNVKSNKRRYWKYTLIAPIILLLVVFLNEPNVSYGKNADRKQETSELPSSRTEVDDNLKKTSEDSEDDGSRFLPFANSCKALNEAVRNQDLEGIKTLLKDQDPNCADPDPGYEVIKRDDRGYTWRRSYPRTPLANAARIGNLEIGKLLVDAGAKADFDRGDHGSPMTEAASRGHLDFLKFLVAEGADLNYMTDGEGTALHCGARNGHLDIVKYALDQGADLNRQNDGQGTALNGAARNGHLETVAFLIEKGADIDKQNDGQGSALNAAARNGHIAVAELLIDEGANINAQRDGQGSALNAAARNGHNKMIELLLAKGADIDSQNDGQGSALNAAARNGHDDTVELLLARGADIDRQNDGQGTALNAAARNGHNETVKLLLSKGANINRQSDGQGSALNAAARNGHYDTVELLLELGADVDRQNDGQGSPLNAAARNGHLDVVKLLVERGANVNQRNSGQGTALDAAWRNRHREVVKFLQSKGAR